MPIIVTRGEAKKVGLKRYFTGKPCPYGHASERYVSSAGCIRCHRERVDAAYRADPEAWKKAVKKNQRAHPEKCRERKNRYRQQNPQERRDGDRRYRQRHPDRTRASGQSRRIRERNSGGDFVAADLRKAFRLQSGRCWYCTKKLGSFLAGGWHADHYMPLSLGGSNNARNIRIACPPCNLRKGSKAPLDFAQGNGLLLI